MAKKDPHSVSSREPQARPEDIRARPTMFIGSVRDGGALNGILWNAIENALDEFLNGFGDRIVVVLHEGESVSVSNEGRETSTGAGARERPDAEEIFSRMHQGDWGPSMGLYKRRDRSRTRLPDLRITCALSDSFALTVWRGGRGGYQRYRQGKPQGALKLLETSKGVGTSVSFSPDFTVFTGVTQFDIASLRRRMRYLAALYPSLNLELHHRDCSERFHEPQGLASLVNSACEGLATLLPEPSRFSIEGPAVPDGVCRVSAAFQWLKEPDLSDFCRFAFLNGYQTTDGGTHVLGMRTGVKQGVEDVASRDGLLGQYPWNNVAEWVSLRTVFAIHVEHPRPTLSSRTRDKLVNGEVAALVRQAMRARTVAMLAEHPEITARLVRPPGS